MKAHLIKGQKGRLDAIKKDLEWLAKSEVLVGVPQQGRPTKGRITNAQLAFLHERGFKSPKWAVLGSYKARFKESKPKAVAALEAYFHEKGDPFFRVPARRFLEPAIEANMDAIEIMQERIIKSVMDGNRANALLDLEKLALLSERWVREWFTDPRNGWPENHPLIVKLKGSDKPLIDTGALRQSITGVVNHAQRR